MLPGGTDGLYRDALAASHTIYSRVEVWSDVGPAAVLLHGDLPFLSGDVSATLTSSVARTFTFTIDESYYPVLATDVLAPYGNVIKAFRGIEFGDGSTTYVWQVFAGRIQDTQLDDNGVVTVQASDFSADVVEHGFEAPENSTPGAIVSNEVRRLIDDAVPGAGFGVFDDYAETVSRQTWQNDRVSALNEMSTAVGSFWYALADGDFVLRRYPWTVSSAPVITVTDGEGGIMTRWSVRRSRQGVYNSETVTAERLNGDIPVYAVARDTNPLSATFYGGHFGVRTRQTYLQTPGSQGAALSAANDALRRDIALLESWSWNQVPDGALELGDVVGVAAAGRIGVIQVVSGFGFSLAPNSDMTVQARSLVVPALLQ